MPGGRPPKDPTQMQVGFLTALSRMEERDDDGTRRIDNDESFLQDVIDEAQRFQVEIWNYRKKILKLAYQGGRSKKKEWWRQLYAERSRNDPIWWINAFAYILNPHMTKYGFPFKMPFILTPKQQEYIKWREDHYYRNKAGLIYKCRDVGVSWCNVAHQAHHWFWEPGYQGRIGSLKAEEVDDKNDPDSLFEKFRVILYNTPKWMRPKSMWDRDNKHDSLMKIVNPDIGSVFSGQQGDKMGRGGRSSAYDIDEFSSILHDKQVDANVSNNSAVVFYTSTPLGRNNDYAEKLLSGKIDVFEFNYWDDPRKSEDWFQNFKEAHSEAVVQQEVLKSLDAFKTGTCIPGEWVQASITLWRKIKAGDIEYSSVDRVAGLDVAAGGTNRSVILHREGIVVEDAREWDIKNTTTLAEKAASFCDEHLDDVCNFDPIAVGVGVKSAFEKMDRLSFRPVPVDARKTASEIPLQGDTKPARERCANRRAELAERLRIRFENTFEFITKGIHHDIESMVAISPDYSKLISQLSVPERLYDSGKIRLEPKEAMARRGEESPDFFDATCYCFADDVKETHVVSEFNPKKDGVIVDDELPVRSLVTMPHTQHYISIYHSDTLAASAIGAVWDSTRLTVYDEVHLTNASVGKMAGVIRYKLAPNPYEYVGNSEMFSQKEDDLFMQYLSEGILVQENFLYNELSAVALLNEMFSRGALTIYRGCKLLLRQLDGFVRSRGTPDLTNMEVVMALCNLINRLKEFGKIDESHVPVRRGYTRTSATKMHENYA